MTMIRLYLAKDRPVLLNQIDRLASASEDPAYKQYIHLSELYGDYLNIRYYLGNDRKKELQTIGKLLLTDRHFLDNWCIVDSTWEEYVAKPRFYPAGTPLIRDRFVSTMVSLDPTEDYAHTDHLRFLLTVAPIVDYNCPYGMRVTEIYQYIADMWLHYCAHQLI